MPELRYECQAMLRTTFFSVLLLAASCAPHHLSGASLQRISRPAFVSRIVEGAGPRSSVFRDDATYRAKLGKIDSKEGDRRLAAKLAHGMTRFELSERLRVSTQARLPR